MLCCLSEVDAISTQVSAFFAQLNVFFGTNKAGVKDGPAPIVAACWPVEPCGVSCSPPATAEEVMSPPPPQAVSTVTRSPLVAIMAGKARIVVGCIEAGLVERVDICTECVEWVLGT